MSPLARLVDPPWWILLVIIVTAMGCDTGDRAEVVVYVAVDRAQAEPLLDRFEARTGILVRAVYDAESAKVTGLVQRLLAESAAPRCDVFWNNEVVQTMLLAERGVLARYESPSAADVLPDWKDPEGRWCGQAVRQRVLVYNSRWVPKDQAPRGLRELLDPRWKGKIAMANPQFGSTRTHVAALFADWGPEPAQDYFRNLVANDVRMVDGNAMVKTLVAQARSASDVVAGLTDSDDVAAGIRDGEPVAAMVPDQDGTGTLVFPTTVSLVRNGPHPVFARKLMDYLLLPETATAMAAPGGGYAPVPRQGIASEGLPRRLRVGFEEVHRQLVPSSQWTAEHVRP